MSENAPPPPPGGTPPPPPPPGGGTPPPPGGGTPPPPGGGTPPPPGGGAPPPGGGWGSAPPPPSGPGGYGGPPGGGQGPAGYSVGTAFTYAFDKFKQNIGPLVLITLILMVSVFVIQLIGNLITGGMSGGLTVDPVTGELEGGGGFFAGAMIVSLLFSAISWAVQLIIQAGIIKASLNLTRGQKVDLGSAFNGINWGQVIVASLLIGVGTFVGLILCILPGIVWIFMTWYTLYFVIDRDMSAVDAIKASIGLVKDNIGALLLFFLAAVAAYIVGACLCGVGLLAAIPVVVIAQAYTFRTLTGDTVTQ